MVNLGAFVNEFVTNLLFFWPVVVFIALALPTFGYFYNRLMDSLPVEHEHTSLYVTGGVIVVLIVGGLISLKASFLFGVLFTLAGTPMIVGDFIRGKRKAKEQAAQPIVATPRKKRMPYAVNSLLDDAVMAGSEAHRLLADAAKNKDDANVMLVRVALAIKELTDLRLKLNEIKSIQQFEK